MNYKKLKKYLKIHMFDSRSEMNEVFKFFARALAGHVEDKLWAKITSIRNSGKSITIEWIRKTFPNFIGIGLQKFEENKD